MRTTLILLGIILFTGLQRYVAAQCIEYAYDASGNRYQRHVCTLKSADYDSTLADNQETPDETDTIGEKNFAPEELIVETIGEMTIKLYPNPTRGTVVIEIVNLQSPENTRLEVYEISGRMVYEQKPVSNRNVINFSQFDKGSYIVKLWTGQKKGEWKIIKV